jgi:hypothetical protein
MANYAMPEVGIGDLVLWHDDPINPSTPAMGWVIEKPGRESVSILVFSQSAGFVEKKSVRHKDDPFWRESELSGKWQIWGCWDFHPSTAMLKELKSMMTKAKLEAAKTKKEVAA